MTTRWFLNLTRIKKVQRQLEGNNHKKPKCKNIKIILNLNLQITNSNSTTSILPLSQETDYVSISELKQARLQEIWLWVQHHFMG